MREAIDAIWDMQAAISKWIVGDGADTTLRADMQKYAHSIEVKLGFLAHHSSVIAGVRWELLGRLGTVTCQEQDMVALSSLDGLLLRVGNSEIARMVMLSAFDGAVAACVNSADTLGRLLNSAYGLGLDYRRASLPEVASRVYQESPLGAVLAGKPGIEWMRPLRRLRGECQHGDLSELLMQGYAARGLEPIVNPKWLPEGTADQRVSDYILSVKARSLALLSGVAKVIATDPGGAIRGP